MPDSVPSFFIFVSLALPGLAFFLLRSQRRMSPERTALVETASLVAVGFVADIIGLGVVAVVHVIEPNLSPDLRELALDSSRYVRDQFWLLMLWWLVVLVVATAFATIVACQDPDNKRLLRILRGPIVKDSSWELVFNGTDVRDAIKWCVCALTDGRTVAGVLASSSPDPRETEERDLILAAPIRHERGPNKWETSDASRLVLGAARIVMIEVHYYSELPTFTESDASVRETEASATLRR